MAHVVRMPAALAGVTEAAIQTWVAQPGQRPCLVEKAIARDAIGIRVGDEFELDQPIQVLVVREVDDAHAAFAERADDAVLGQALGDVEAADSDGGSSGKLAELAL